MITHSFKTSFLLMLVVFFALSACQSAQTSAGMVLDNANSVVTSGTDEDIFWGKADGKDAATEGSHQRNIDAADKERDDEYY